MCLHVCVYIRTGPHSLDGYMYNLRLWDELVPLQDLQQLQLQGCDAAGSLLDWDKQHWDIPASRAQTDPSLSCSEYSQLLTAAKTKEKSEKVNHHQRELMLTTI